MENREGGETAAESSSCVCVTDQHWHCGIVLCIGMNASASSLPQPTRPRSQSQSSTVATCTWCMHHDDLTHIAEVIANAGGLTWHKMKVCLLFVNEHVHILTLARSKKFRSKHVGSHAML